MYNNGNRMKISSTAHHKAKHSNGTDAQSEIHDNPNDVEGEPYIRDAPSPTFSPTDSRLPYEEPPRRHNPPRSEDDYSPSDPPRQPIPPASKYLNLAPSTPLPPSKNDPMRPTVKFPPECTDAMCWYRFMMKQLCLDRESVNSLLKCFTRSFNPYYSATDFGKSTYTECKRLAKFVLEQIGKNESVRVTDNANRHLELVAFNMHMEGIGEAFPTAAYWVHRPVTEFFARPSTTKNPFVAMDGRELGNIFVAYYCKADGSWGAEHVSVYLATISPFSNDGSVITHSRAHDPFKNPSYLCKVLICRSMVSRQNGLVALTPRDWHAHVRIKLPTVCVLCRDPAVLSCPNCRAACYCSETCRISHFTVSHHEECFIMLERKEASAAAWKEELRKQDLTHVGRLPERQGTQIHMHELLGEVQGVEEEDVDHLDGAEDHNGDGNDDGDEDEDAAEDVDGGQSDEDEAVDVDDEDSNVGDGVEDDDDHSDGQAEGEYHYSSEEEDELVRNN